jgi:hypothetical protein
MAFGHFLLGSHYFMVTALGSCVKWPFIYIFRLCHCALSVLFHHGFPKVENRKHSCVEIYIKSLEATFMGSPTNYCYSSFLQAQNKPKY